VTTGQPAPFRWCGDASCSDWHCRRCGAHASYQGHWTMFCRAIGEAVRTPHFCCPDRCELSESIKAESAALLARTREAFTERTLQRLAGGDA